MSATDTSIEARAAGGRRAAPGRAAGGLLAALAILLAAQTSFASPPSGAVRDVRRDMVYVGLGRADGVRVGDTLTGPGGVKLEVVTVGERQLVARRVGAAAVRAGAKVTAPREPGAAAARRPVVSLPNPEALAQGLPWAGDPGRRDKLIPTPGEDKTKPQTTAVRGEFLVSYAGVLDQGDNDLDLHQLQLRSKLVVGDLLGGHLEYRHDVAGRLELGPNLDGRQGADSRGSVIQRSTPRAATISRSATIRS